MRYEVTLEYRLEVDAEGPAEAIAEAKNIILKPEGSLIAASALILRGYTKEAGEQSD
jgi:hypothetical protein